jgi:hypothetical protein
VWLPLVGSDGRLTPYGNDYLSEVSALTTTGCTASSDLQGTAPANTSLPTIEGNNSMGDQLSASAGTWSGDPAPAFAYQWRRCDANGAACSEIPQAIASTYVIQPDDVGSRLAVAVTAVNATNFATAQSAPTPVITALPTSGGSTSGPPPGGGSTSGPPSGGAAGGISSPHRLASMAIRIVRIRRRGAAVTATVRYRRHSGSVAATARTRRAQRIRRVRLKVLLTSRRRGTTTVIFSATLRPGRWTVTFTATPAQGYARPEARARRISVLPA